MNTGMKDIDWKQYLDTLPTGDPTEWFADILAAFKKQWIDYVDAYLAVQKYSNLGNDFQQAAIDTVVKLQQEDKRQDISMAYEYIERHKTCKEYSYIIGGGFSSDSNYTRRPYNIGYAGFTTNL